MELIRFDKQHYPLVTSWWTAKEHPVIPLEMLSQFGFVYFEAGQPIAASFIYMAGDCDFAQIAWTTTNPEATLRARYRGVEHCTKALMQLAKRYNKTNIVSFCDSSGVGKIYQKNTFKKLRSHDLFYSKLGAL